jgi:hypothetical protein
MSIDKLEKFNYITNINLNLTEVQKLIKDQINKTESMSRK